MHRVLSNTVVGVALIGTSTSRDFVYRYKLVLNFTALIIISFLKACAQFH